MRLRPLLEHGSVALVPEEVVKVLAAEPAYGATDAALTSGALINWVKSQLRVGGPTDREVIFVDTRDASDLGEMFLYARVVEPPNEHGTFRTEALSHRYDPDHDYQPWIDQTRGQVAARHIQTANFNLAVAGLLGGQFIATSLFDARLLARLGSVPATPHSLIWADVPSLPQAEPATLAKIAAEDKTVEALRRTVRRGMRAAGDPSVNATEIADQLREDARLLERAIQRDRIWKLAVPAALGVSGLGLGVVAGGALGAASAVLGTAGGLSPLLGDRDSRRENAAYAVYIANRARRGKR